MIVYKYLNRETSFCNAKMQTELFENSTIYTLYMFDMEEEKGVQKVC